MVFPDFWFYPRPVEKTKPPRRLAASCSSFVLVVVLILSSLGKARAQEIVVVPLHGEVSTAQFFFLRRALKEAETQKASALILDIDTYGGELKAATKILDALFKTSVPTIAYINTNAGSAGALVALSTRQIYMAPVSAIGAAAPVSGGGENLPSTMNDKVVSYFSGYFRSAAEKNGYNPDIAEAFISKDKEVKIGDNVVHAKGSLLTLSAQEAVRVLNGKPMLAAGVADSIDDLVAKTKIAGNVRTISPTGFERLALWVTALAPIFLLIGIVGAYLEFKLQGTILPGAIATIAFLIFFTGHYLAGLAGWEVLALFVIGAALVISELVLHPGTVVPGVVGVLVMVAALLWAMIDRYPSQPFVPSSEMLVLPILRLGGAMVAAAIVIAILARYLPRTSLYGRFVLAHADAQGPSFSAHTASAQVEVGAEGVARSVLRPTGNADFNGVLLDVITRGEFVAPGSALRVLAVEGSRVVVEELKS